MRGYTHFLACASCSSLVAVRRRALRKERMGAFKQLLVAQEIGVRSQWRKVQSQLQDEESFRHLEKIDRLQVHHSRQ